MSSGPFEAELKADQCGRKVVFRTGIALGVAGTAVALTMPFPWPGRVLLTLLWLTDVVLSLNRLRQGWAHCDRLRISSTGDIRVTGPGGVRQPVTLATGTLVLRRFAWLRYTTPEGSARAEFLICRSPQDVDWHRFQVIWRLARSAFGQRDRA